MTIKAIKEKVSVHISKARPEQALAILQEWANLHGSTTAQTIANLISSDFNALKREEIMGVARDVGRRRSEINLRILEFNWETNDTLFKIEKSIEEKPNPKMIENLEMEAKGFKNVNNSLVFEHGYALFIGIRYGHWQHGILNGTLQDVEALEKHFTHPQKAAYLPQNIILLKEEHATTQGILTALDDFANKVNQDPKATAILYFSGHGATDDKYDFLVPYDFDLSAYWNRKLNLDQLILSNTLSEKIAKIRAQKCLVILDCCHSENMPIPKDLRLIRQSQLAAAVDSGLTKNLLKGSGTVLLTACEADETALDLGSNGLFTKVLLDCLNGVDTRKQDGWVRLTDLMDYVPKTVAADAQQRKHSQHPVFKRISDLKGDEYIICAYDIAQAKGLKPFVQPTVAPRTDAITWAEIAEMIDNEDFLTVFSKLKGIIPQNDKFQFNQFQKQYSAGLSNYELIQFSKRFKVFASGFLS